MNPLPDGSPRDLLVRLYPQLFHVSAAGSWPCIARHGLLSAHRVADLFDVGAERRTRLLHDLRKESHALELDGVGRAVLRDQRPLHRGKLEKSFEDTITVSEWLDLLNGYVFFWPLRHRVDTLLKTYSDESHDVLVVDTAEFVARYGAEIRISRMNTGTTSPMAHPRGRKTFQPLDGDFLEMRRSKYGRKAAVAEVVVANHVPDIAEFTVCVERWNGTSFCEIIWQQGSPLP